FQAEDGIRDRNVTGVQTCALPIWPPLETPARAGVSKGGLLYHFASKEALAEGLIARLDALVEEDLAAMREAADGPSRYYVRTSRSEERRVGKEGWSEVVGDGGRRE